MVFKYEPKNDHKRQSAVSPKLTTMKSTVVAKLRSRKYSICSVNWLRPLPLYLFDDQSISELNKAFSKFIHLAVGIAKCCIFLKLCLSLKTSERYCLLPRDVEKLVFIHTILLLLNRPTYRPRSW